MTKSSERKTAIIYALCASLTFSLMGLIATYLANTEHVPVGQIAFFRVFVTCLLLAPFMKLKGISLLGKKRQLIFLRGFIGFLSLSLGFYALSKIPMAEVSVLWKSSIIFTAIFSAIALKERISAVLALWSALAMAGAMLILKPGDNMINVGGLAAFSAGMLVSVVAVSIRKLHQTEHSETITFGFSFWGSLMALIMFAHTFVLPTASQFGLLLAIGVLGLFGQLFFTRAFKYAPAYVVQPMTLSEVPISAGLGFLFFSQKPDFLSAVGTLAIIVAGIGIFRRK